jgi:hypothetical protein
MKLRNFIKKTTRKYLNEQDVLMLIDRDDIWYHGGDSKITTFLKMPPINRRGNTEGFYFTKNIDYARNHGNEITKVKLKIKKPFILGKTNVSKDMINTYAIELHKENDHLPLEGSWIKEKCQYFQDKKYMPYTGLDGLAQQEVYKSGGFDSVIDGHEICVFDSNNIIILDDINELTKKGSEHTVDIDDTYVIKSKIKGDFDTENKSSWFYIFKNNPEIFPIIYDINKNQIKLEKLDTDKAENEIKKMKDFLYQYGDSWTRNMIENEYGSTSRILFQSIGNLDYMVYILKKYGDIEIKKIFKKWINFFKELSEIKGSGFFEVHDYNFGYSKNNKLKMLDI